MARRIRPAHITWPEPASNRALTTIADDGGSDELLLVHDVALRDDTELLDAVNAMVLAAWRHERMIDVLANALSDLEDSRQRIAEAADVERARIERDLHDGAQQRLLGLRIRLALVEERLNVDPAAAIDDIHELGSEAERAMEELRSRAHGVYPSLLLDHGIVDALRSIALQAPTRIRVAPHGVTRHPLEIESAIYFTCIEAAQNATKHAASATGIWITLMQTTRSLRFDVRDYGPGFDPRATDGRGLRNMRDRMEAIGGQLTIDGRLGHGARVHGSIDLTRRPGT